MRLKCRILLLLFSAIHATVITPEQAYTLVRRYGWNESTFNKTPVRFGTPISLEATNRYFVLSRYMSNAWELFFHWLNKVHGGIRLNGTLHPVELYLINDDSKKAQVNWATQRLVDYYGVKFLFGPYSSGLTMGMAEIANASGATMLASGAANAAVFRDRPQLFGTSTPGDEWVAPAIEMFAQMANPPKRIAFLQEDLGFPKFTCSSLASLTAANNMTIVNSFTVTAGAEMPEILDVIDQLAAASPDVVFSCNYNNVCKRLIQAAKNRSFNPKAFVLTTCVPGADFIQDLQRDGLYVMGTAAWSENLASSSVLTNLTAMEFYDMYVARYNEPPHYLSAAAFSAGATFVNAIESSNSLDPKIVADTLRAMDVQTVYGRISFNDVGLCKNKMKIVEWQNLLGVTVVAPSEVALATGAYPKPTWMDLKCLDPRTDLTIWGYDEQGMNCGLCADGKASSFEALGNNSGKRICSACPMGRSLIITDEVGDCIQCRNGTFWCGVGWQSPEYASYTSAKLRESYICNSSTTISQCFECTPGRYADEEGLTLCKECQPGKFQNIPGKKECTNCEDWDARRHPHAFSATNASISCIPCPKGAVCEHDSNGLRSGYSNADGYFLVEQLDYSSDFVFGRLYKCQHGDGDACLSNKRCYVDPTSDEVSMEGPFCGTCKAGFAKGEAANLCKKCGSTGDSWGLAFSIQVLLFMVSALLFLAQVIKHPRALLGTHHIIFRQFLNYVQLSTAVFPVVELSGAGNKFISTLGSLQYLFAARSPVAVSRGAECYVEALFPDMDLHKAWVISGLCMVPCWLVFALCVHYALRMWCRFRELPVPGFTQLALWVSMNLYVIQPRLTQLFLVPFDCKYMDQIRLLADTTFVCDTPGMLWWMFLGALGLACFSLGIPLTLAAILHSFHAENRLHSPECMERYRFFFQGYIPEYYYFEAVNMVRKVMFYMAAFIPWLSPGDEDDSTLKALTSVSLLLLTMVFLAIHLRCRPYDFREFHILHEVETAMLIAFLVTCLTQTWVYMSSKAWIFSEASEHHERNTDLRDALCSAVVIFFHIRFFVILLFGVYGKSIRRAPLYQKYIAARVNLKFADDSNGKNTGITVGHLSDASRVYIAEAFGELAETHLDHPYFSYEEFNNLLRRVAVEAFYHKDRRRFQDTMPWLQRTIVKKVMSMPDSLGEREWVQKISEKIKPSCEVEGNAPWRMNPFYSMQYDSLTHYEIDHLQQALKETYSIEDLQMAVMQLVWMDRRTVSKSSMLHKATEAAKLVGNVFSPRPADIEVLPLSAATTMDSDSKKSVTTADRVVPVDSQNTEVSAMPILDEDQLDRLERERDSLYRALRFKEAELMELEGLQAFGDAESDEEEWA